MFFFVIPITENTGELYLMMAKKLIVYYTNQFVLNTKKPQCVKSPTKERIVFHMGIHDIDFEKINMKTILDKNNWTLTIDEDIKKLTQEQLFEVAKLINRHFVVIFKNQNLTIEDELRITSTIGKVKLDHGKDEEQRKAILLQPVFS